MVRMKHPLDKGVEIPLSPMDPEKEITYNKTTLERGNHKGATSQPDLLNELVTKDIQHAFVLPFFTSSSSTDKRWLIYITQHCITVDNK